VSPGPRSENEERCNHKAYCAERDLQWAVRDLVEGGGTQWSSDQASGRKKCTGREVNASIHGEAQRPGGRDQDDRRERGCVRVVLRQPDDGNEERDHHDAPSHAEEAARESGE
jgi:hypothetical protein